ncbi:stalk domain-containing protein [Paenibacillus ginsengarvi]|uniref:Copper amine oxidase N-terminal domain-containing protein n=1 Tax=Paenibacillus ginsengarvi TaxID=400777 RepID=A0A3B0BXH9_9BACL|nr:stalk domain-containing protein [Paenibacillus ginsengarvi]RKN78225.1 copper amine oxidase N-terminal domain-containing protein [Paenibacillus ginsengarvi]
MKKHLRTGIAAIFALSVSVTGAAAYAAADQTPVTTSAQVISQALSQNTAISVNDKALATGGYVKTGGKEAMVPLRDIAEALGLTVTWNEENRSAEISGQALWTSVKLGEDQYSVNKMYITLGTAPELTDSKTFVPVSFVDKVLHATVKTEGASIAITSGEQKKTALTKGVITSVYENEGRQTVRINGIGTDGLVLHVGQDTVYEKADGTKISFADLTLGQQIEVEHSLAATLSLPPQTAAYKIVVLDQTIEKNSAGTAGQIEEVRTGDDGATSLLIKGEGLTEQTPDELVLRLTDKTVIVDTEGRTVEAKELVKGAKVIGFYNGILTRSLPPIGSATTIVLQAAPTETTP